MSEREIFIEAISRDPLDRAAWLDSACAGDVGLRDRIERLLALSTSDGSLLDQPLSSVLSAAGVGAGTNSHIRPSAGEPTARLLDLLNPSNHLGSMGRLGHYDVREIPGEGGFGVVVRAFDDKLHRVVAIKALAPHLAESGSARRRFIREARAAAAVIHDNVIAIYAVDDEGPLPYLVMQCIEGKTLQQKIDEGPLNAEAILRIGSQIADGLAAAHRCGLVHRDIKPANILLENGVERVKITDFGLADVAGSVADASASPVAPNTDSARVESFSFGFLAGTPQYMSPEQAAGETLDARSDLFSLGGVLYAMATGRPPFLRETTFETLAAVRTETPVPLDAAAPHLPSALRAIIHRLLSKDQEQRFASASDVAAALREISLSNGASGTTEMRGRRASDRVAPADSRRAADRVPAPLASRKGRIGWFAAVALVVVVSSFGMTEATGVTQVSTTVLRLLRPEGTLIVEARDPGLRIAVDGEDLIIQGAGPKEIRLKAGQHHLEATKDGRVVRQELVTISRDGREVVTVGIEPPPVVSPAPMPPAVAAETGKIEPEETWLPRVLALPHAERFQAIVARLNAVNAEFRSKYLRYEVTGDEATVVFMLDSNLTNVSPLKAFPTLQRLTVRDTSLVDFSPLSKLPLVRLDAFNSQIADLRPLAAMPLERLILRRTPIQDLSPLSSLPLQYLAIEYTEVRDLTPLKGMKLETLLCADSKVTDLTPLVGMPLRELAIAGLRVSDIRPLAGMQLTTLYLDRSDVSDLSPIAGMPLTRLTLGRLHGIDLKHLDGMPLEELWLDFDLDRDGPFLRTLKSLRKINGKQVSEVLP